MQENNSVPFTLYAEKAKLSMTGGGELLSAGMSGVIQVQFTFSGDWDGLEKTAVFTNGTRNVHVDESQWDEGICIVPEEVLVTAGKTVTVGVFGTDGLRLVLPTVWCVLGRVEPAADLSGEPVSPGSSLRDLISRIEALETGAQADHTALADMLPRSRQASKTQAHSVPVAADENGALFIKPAGLKTLAAAYNGNRYSYYGADFDFTTLDEVMSMGENGQQIRLVILGSNDVYFLTHMSGAASTARLYFTGLTYASGMDTPTVDVFQIDNLMGITRISSAPVPTKLSELTNDCGFLRDADGSVWVPLTLNGSTLSLSKSFQQITDLLSALKPVYFYTAVGSSIDRIFRITKVDDGNDAVEIVSESADAVYSATMTQDQGGASMSGTLVTYRPVEKMAVTISSSGGIYTSDKTAAEIYSAAQAGKILEVSIDNIAGWPGEIVSGSATFYAVDDSGGTVILYSCIVTAGGVTASAKRIDNEEPVLNTVSGATATIAAANNSIYACGVLTSLTVSSFPAAGSFTIIFTSGAAATTLSVPNTLHMPDGFTVEANTRYEINVCGGYAAVGSWAVSA